MTVKYTNQQNQLYHLHKKLTKRGNFRYYFSKDDKINLVEKIPDSYEIYENPKGQVFLRKKNKNFISKEDIKLVEKILLEHTDFEHFYINSLRNNIILYLPDLNLDDLSGTLNITLIGDEIKLNQFSPDNLTYSPFIQIIQDKDKKSYILEKIDTDNHLGKWNYIDESDSINSLIMSNLKHFSNNTYSKLKILFL